ncbi:MAG: gfo/Idh/MocA family oxidoreductase, partial [Pedobacter sp.]
RAEVPKDLDWDLWLGTAPYKEYVNKLVPFNWRGWWDYGTGALGDMGCHLLEAPFSVLDLKYAKSVEASVGSVYVDEFKRGYFPESCPPSSHVTLKFPKSSRTQGDVTVHWMDGGIQPERPEELQANEVFGDGGNGTLFIGTKGKMMSSTYSANPRLLPLSKNQSINVKETYTRVKDEANGHYAQWVEAAIAGHGKHQLSSPFEIAGPLTEALLMANLAIRGADIQRKDAEGKITYPGRYTKLLWDNDAMKVTNFDDVNQFVKREYRKGWTLGF